MSKSTSVRLPDNLHRRLKDVAAHRGKTVNGLIVETLEREFEELPADSNRGDIALAKFIGCVSSEGHYDARDAENEFGRILEAKYRDGHL